MFNRICNDNKIRPVPFFICGQLFGTDHFELFHAHCATLHDALFLNLGRCPNAGNAVHVRVAPCFKQQRNIKHQDITLRACDKICTVLNQQRDARFFLWF